MAQTLEKIFLQKVAQMPPEEQEIVVPVAKNSHKKGASRAAGNGHTIWGGTAALGGGGSLKLRWDPRGAGWWAMGPPASRIPSRLGSGANEGLLVSAQRSWRDSRLLSKCRLSPLCPTPLSTPQALTSPPP